MFQRKQEEQPDLELFVVFDSKSKTYEPPLLAPNKDVLLRDILNRFKDPKSATENKYFINAEDYSLFRVGSFTKRTGVLQSQNLEHVSNFHDLRALCEPDRALYPT